MEDALWYVKANRYCRSLSEKYNVSTIQVAGIVAALSPLKNWDINKQIADDFLRTGTAGHIKFQLSKCHRIMQTTNLTEICEILNGNKIVSFFLNIVDPGADEQVTIDSHAVGIAVNKYLGSVQITKNQYEFFANCYRIAARELEVLPLELQAITWVTWRKLKKSKI